MNFTEAKFRSLSISSQAKKCADLLHLILDRPHEDWKGMIRQYNEMCRWQGRSDLCQSPDTLKASRLMDAYQCWRKLAGLGPEKSVLAIPFEYDRKESLEEPCDWWVWMHNIRSAHNVGSILRTADCLGWSGAHLTGYSPDADHKGVQSAAMGAEKWFPSRKWDQTEDFLGQNQYPIYALEITPDAVSIEDMIWPVSGVLLLGNEELGVNPVHLELCTGVIKIPLYGRKGSLNVAQAFAVAAWEQRRKFVLPQNLC